ncbi:MAG: hypothetical protein WCT85_03520 [Parachlamydiales bacterium]|jgi:hypothetical protein
MSVKNISSNLLSFDYTKSILPKQADSILKKIGKVALIIFTLGSIFLITAGFDLCAIAHKMIHRSNAPKTEPSKSTPAVIPAEKPTTFQKTVSFVKSFYEGITLGASLLIEIPKVTSDTFNLAVADKNIVYTYLAGYILTTTAALAIVGGNRGLLSGIGIHLLGISYVSLKEKVWVPLELKSLPIINEIKEKVFTPVKKVFTPVKDAHMVI